MFKGGLKILILSGVGLQIRHNRIRHNRIRHNRNQPKQIGIEKARGNYKRYSPWLD